MMNLMIVEDEVLVRMGLRTLIDWEKSGVHTGCRGEGWDGGTGNPKAEENRYYYYGYPHACLWME